jgi:hypothetical protein
MHYRSYLLGLDNGIKRGHDVHSSTDLEAFAAIEPIVGISLAAELWCGTRCVGRWKSAGIEVTASDWAGAEAASPDAKTIRRANSLSACAP